MQRIGVSAYFYASEWALSVLLICECIKIVCLYIIQIIGDFVGFPIEALHLCVRFVYLSRQFTQTGRVQQRYQLASYLLCLHIAECCVSLRPLHRVFLLHRM